MKKSMSFAAVALMALAACVTSCTKEDIVATTISTDPTSVVMYVDSTVQLQATVEPTNAKVTWESEDLNTAMVDANGLVTAKAAGEVKIFAVSGTMRAATKITIYNNPCTVSLKMNEISQKKASVHATPSDNEGYYYCGFAPKSVVKDMTDSELLDVLFSNLMAQYEQYKNYGYTLDKFLKQGEMDLTASGMTASTDYQMFAYGVDIQSQKPSPIITRVDFRTADVVASNMTFTIQYDSVSYVVNSKNKVDTLVYFSAHPSSDKETYLFNGAEKGYLTEKFDGDPEKFMANLEATYDKQDVWDKVLRTGVGSIRANNPEDGSVWVLIAAGYNGGFTTKMKTFEYTYNAPKNGKPARLVPRVQEDDALEIEEVLPFSYIPGMCH